jgi:hypothetical protein
MSTLKYRFVPLHDPPLGFRICATAWRQWMMLM